MSHLIGDILNVRHTFVQFYIVFANNRVIDEHHFDFKKNKKVKHFKILNANIKIKKFLGIICHLMILVFKDFLTSYWLLFYYHLYV